MDNCENKNKIQVRRSERIKRRLKDIDPEDIGENDYAKDKNYKGWNHYTRLKGKETLIGIGTVFFVNQLKFRGQTTLGSDCWN